MSVNAKQVRVLLDQVKDPEIPTLSIIDLAILRDVSVDGTTVAVTITPTYSGCPAMQLIEDEILKVLDREGFSSVEIKTVHSPAWTTDWMSAEAKAKLKKVGIAPPCMLAGDELVVFPSTTKTIPCPFCDSEKTVKKSEFGSTACKAIYYCEDCCQPFDYFKEF